MSNILGFGDERVCGHAKAEDSCTSRATYNTRNGNLLGRLVNTK